MKIEDFRLDLHGDIVPWRLFVPSESTKEYGVLWLQGWSSSMDSHLAGVKRIAEQTNTAFVTLDYAGHGLHALHIDQSTRRQQHQEVVGVFDAFKALGYQNIIVIGGSFGGYMAALLTSARQVNTVVLRAPAMYADDEFETVHSKTTTWLNPKRDPVDRAADPYISDNAAVRAIRAFSGMTYVMEHELDEVVPSNMPRTYFENAKYANYILIPKTKHSPKLMKNPERHFAYIEHYVCAIIEATKLQKALT